jgi:hypothetical protein
MSVLAVARSLNGLKHSGYSNLGLLPGEDPEKFVALIKEIAAELKPIGAIENDIAYDIGRCVWRKKNLKIYARATDARKQWDEVFSKRDEPGWFLPTELHNKVDKDRRRSLAMLEYAQASAKV